MYRIATSTVGRLTRRALTKPVVQQKTFLVFKNVPRFYATSANNNDQEFVQLRIEEILQKINSNPGVSAAFTNLQEILVNKGLVKDDKTEFHYSDYFKLLMDKDVKNALKAVKSAMEEANVLILPEEIDPLLKILTKKGM